MTRRCRVFIPILIFVMVSFFLLDIEIASAEGFFSPSNSLELLPLEKKFIRKRFSSYNVTGQNSDNVKIKSGEKRVIVETGAAGCIRHIWCTIGRTPEGKCEEYYLRKIVIRMFWDGSKEPSVEIPIGDFFGMGHGISRNFISAPLQMGPENGTGFNCWFPMPFAKGARIEIQNECSHGINFYFYVDWEKYNSLGDNLFRFHASWNREITKGISEEGIGPMEFQDKGENTTGEGNYVILDAIGEGHYVGCNVNIQNRRFSWYWDWPGEGDDMIFIDGEKWPPDIHGTGTEDYFNSAYCPTQYYTAPYHGIILGGGINWADRITYYRYHILDPIPFTRSIRVTIEHGHANRRYDDWSSTAYWYQRGTGSIKRVPPVEERLPLEREWTLKYAFNRFVAHVILWPIYQIFYSQ